MIEKYEVDIAHMTVWGVDYHGCKHDLDPNGDCSTIADLADLVNQMYQEAAFTAEIRDQLLDEIKDFDVEFIIGDCVKNGHDLRYVEDVAVYRSVNDLDSGKAIVDPLVEDHDYEGGHSPRFICFTCETEYHLKDVQAEQIRFETR